jgi:hypothetical protein
MHMTWVRYTCGRLKSDFRYSKDIVYNNFPWPGCAESLSAHSLSKAVTEAVSGGGDSATNASNFTDTYKAKIETAAQAILDARALYPQSSLADLYDPPHHATTTKKSPRHPRPRRRPSLQLQRKR